MLAFLLIEAIHHACSSRHESTGITNGPQDVCAWMPLCLIFISVKRTAAAYDNFSPL